MSEAALRVRMNALSEQVLQLGLALRDALEQIEKLAIIVNRLVDASAPTTIGNDADPSPDPGPS